MSAQELEFVKTNIEKLDQIGKTASGGTSRLSYSQAWSEGVAFASGLMTEAGMTVERDPIGNIIGTYQGIEPTLPYLLVGSHLDTVPEGGSLDGALGVIGAIACIRSWYQAGYRPMRTVKVIATVEEEGTRFGLGCMGTRYIAGELTAEKLLALADKEGKTLESYLADNTMDFAQLANGLIQPKDVFAFLELHVEQGYELDLSGQPCAIVTDIVGIDRHWITLEGHANHAGTTRMDRRRDALVAASMLVEEMYQAATASQGLYVATVGAFNVLPGATNVIPGQVELTIETRAAKDATLEAVHKEIELLLAKVAEKYKVKTQITNRRFAPAVALSGKLVEEFGKAAGDVSLSVPQMPSWAGHDAKIMATVTACAMLFVTSLNGTSHSPLEATKWEDVEKGLMVFKQMMKRIASMPIS